jgi:DENN (AEX-3) domain
MVDFVVPLADRTTEDGADGTLYGVSLVLRRVSDVSSEKCGENRWSEELCPSLRMHMQERTWLNLVGCREGTDATVGLALVCGQNLIILMRDILRSFLEAHCGLQVVRGRCSLISCSHLVSLLGAFSQSDVDPTALKGILSRHVNSSLQPPPTTSPRDAYELLAGERLLKALPPIPLALLLVTALLEQKIVFSSSRRGLLVSASLALKMLLAPLKWCHLFVPYVPGALAHDLLQYPAPFILGLASDDGGVMELLRELPQDVTLVDLDVGRVILAPSFAHDSEMGRGTPNNENTARALRSQVLYLAQSLGMIIGSQVDESSWYCDRPAFDRTKLLRRPEITESRRDDCAFKSLKEVCGSFVEEIVAGTTSCCYWVEESSALASSQSRVTSEPVVLFDEDRFFEIKNLRASNEYPRALAGSGFGMPLGLDEFDLILEVFLRCQSMNAYISSRLRQDMQFSL